LFVLDGIVDGRAQVEWRAGWRRDLAVEVDPGEEEQGQQDTTSIRHSRSIDLFTTAYCCW
jgi:hypothetical protein